MSKQSESSCIKKPAKDFWMEHVKQWKSSQLSQQVYCNQAGINYGTFVYWRGQFLLESGQSKSRQFFPVAIKPSYADTPQSVKIKLSTGHVVCIPVSIGIDEIAKLIRLLEVPHA